MVILTFFVVHWYASLFTQTFFHHRYGAHKMFTMNKFWEKVFYVLVYIFQGSSYLNPRAYGIMHRMHHSYSDTEKDPHSPHIHKSIWAMMWQTRLEYNQLVTRQKEVDPQFSKGLPEWKLIDKIGESNISRYAWGLAYIAFYVAFATHWWMYFLLPVHILMGPVHGAIVNWFGHKLGYANFDNKDKSKNTLVWDFLMLGELFQNNHHKYGSRSNFAIKWYELDPTYPVMKFLSWVKIINMDKNSSDAPKNPGKRKPRAQKRKIKTTAAAA